MKTLYSQQERDIEAVQSDNCGRGIYYHLPERRRTAAVSLAAVAACGGNLEYVPQAVLTPEICRIALKAKDVDCDILMHVPFPDVVREGVEKFISSGVPAFVVYSFADIQDARMAKEAVKADAYCLQLVPDHLITTDLCQTALQSPNADKKVLGFIPDRLFTPETREAAVKKFGRDIEKIPENGLFQQGNIRLEQGTDRDKRNHGKNREKGISFPHF
jgi:hypothetical protein